MKKCYNVLILMVVLGVSQSVWAEKACYEVQGMTCSACGITLKAAVKKIKGITNVSASVEKKNAIIQYDPVQTNTNIIQKAIDEIGYKAISKDCKIIEG